jgi:hypothetical protein
MTKLQSLLLTILFAPLLAHATIFDFSYEFQSGYGDNRGLEQTSVNGSFTGQQDGIFVTHISNINVSIQGRDFSNNLTSILFSPATGAPWDTSQEGAVSFDVALNNFMFTDSDYVSNGTSTNYFYIFNYDNFTQRQASNDNGGYSYGFDIDSATNDSWKLSARSVPEPSSLLLLIIGLGLIPLLRKKITTHQIY